VQVQQQRKVYPHLIKWCKQHRKVQDVKIQTHLSIILYVHFLSHFFILPSQFAHKVLRLLFCTFLLLLEYHIILSNTTLNNSENSTQLINNLLTCHVTCRIPHYSFYCQAGHSIIDKLHTLKLSYVEISIENF
jgi:hypothetical protein